MAVDYTESFIKQLEAGSHQRVAQAGICFVNAFRKFFHHRSWMVLPMTAVLSLIAGLAIRDGFLTSLDGTMTGAFVLVGVCIWNGTYSSIQAICRERAIIREKKRLKLHSSSYTAGNMLLQFLICVAETGIVLVMLRAAGIRYTGRPLFTQWFVVDFGITIFLIIYASDMVALFISALCRTKTAAMTILPFVLVLQLVFSGSIISIPDSIDPIAMITVSRPGFKAMSAQADLNHLPIALVGDIMTDLEDTPIEISVTLGQVLDLLSDADNPAVAKARNVKIGTITTVGDLNDQLLYDERLQGLRDTKIFGGLTVGILLSEINDAQILDDFKDKKIGMEITVGEAVDLLANNAQLAGFRNEGIDVETTVGEVLELLGREETQSLIEEKAAMKYYDPALDQTRENVLSNWTRLLVLLLVFAVGTAVVIKSVGAWPKRRARA